MSSDPLSFRALEQCTVHCVGEEGGQSVGGRRGAEGRGKGWGQKVGGTEWYVELTFEVQELGSDIIHGLAFRSNVL